MYTADILPDLDAFRLASRCDMMQNIGQGRLRQIFIIDPAASCWLV
jgi:alkyl hydroperoxide reductase subunit AhpC